MSLPSTDLHSSGDFIQILMRLYSATYRINSPLDLDKLFERIVNEIAVVIGTVEVSVWLREAGAGEMVLYCVRGCTHYRKGHRLNAGRGLVCYAAASGEMRYAPDVLQDPLYITCEPATRSEVSIPIKTADHVIGVLCIDNDQTDAFSFDQLTLLQALGDRLAVAVDNAKSVNLRSVTNTAFIDI